MEKMHKVKGQSYKLTDSPSRILPSFTVLASDFPAVKAWKVGETYKIEAEVELTALEKSEWQDGEPLNARMKIKAIAVDQEDTAEDMPLDQFHSYKGEVLKKGNL